MAEQEMKKRCFIITPIGGERTDIRDALDGLLKNVLEPVLLDLGFRDKDITVAHQMKDSGSINTQLIARIVEDELCIVNLTGLNPNVMYELAIRHAVGKPVVIIAEHGTKLPFDIIDQRTIFYSNTMLGAVYLKESLREMVENILSNPEQIPDNPIIKIIKDNAILDEIKSDGKEHDELTLILDKIANLETRISKTTNNYNNINEGQNKKIPTETWILEDKKGIRLTELVSLFGFDKATISRLSKTNQIIVEFFYVLSNVEINRFENIIKEHGMRIITKF
ncbi:hypothetical protein [Lysinibacillus sphaericus]|uniref:hypothetical protein n=1 Tax=Lysinibacillus sphaericus TaxID=1421 RepID=UPI0018CFDE3F|nr:hypothetical protein [Lysinibacillus sphaericus]